MWQTTKTTKCRKTISTLPKQHAAFRIYEVASAYSVAGVGGSWGQRQETFD